MEQFSIKGHNGHFELKFVQVFGFPEQTSPWGGYDVKGEFKIRVGEYSAEGELWFSTGEIYQLYEDLKAVNEVLNGTIYFNTHENNLEFKLVFDNKGHIVIKGKYIAAYSRKNELSFEIESDQSFMTSSLSELQRIVQKYGTKEGLKQTSE